MARATVCSAKSVGGGRGVSCREPTRIGGGAAGNKGRRAGPRAIVGLGRERRQGGAGEPDGGGIETHRPWRLPGSGDGSELEVRRGRGIQGLALLWALHRTARDGEGAMRVERANGRRSVGPSRRPLFSPAPARPVAARASPLGVPSSMLVRPHRQPSASLKHRERDIWESRLERICVGSIFRAEERRSARG